MEGTYSGVDIGWANRHNMGMTTKEIALKVQSEELPPRRGGDKEVPPSLSATFSATFPGTLSPDPWSFALWASGMVW
jgi:hypothetical protein